MDCITGMQCITERAVSGSEILAVKDGALHSEAITDARGEPVFTVEEGTLAPRRLLDGHVVIIAEHLPTWLLMVGTHICGTSHILVYTGDESSWFRHNCRKVQATFFPTLGGLCDHISNLSSQVVHLLFQGQGKFLQETTWPVSAHLSVVGFATDVIVVLGVGRIVWRQFPWQLKWTRIHHWAFGGVTESVTSVGLMGERSPLPKPSGISQFLSGVLKFARGGKECPVPKMDTLLIRQKVPIKALD